MKTQRIANWKMIATFALFVCGMMGTGCTQDQTDAVLAGVQAATAELGSSNDEVTFRDWLSSAIDN